MNKLIIGVEFVAFVHCFVCERKRAGRDLIKLSSGRVCRQSFEDLLELSRCVQMSEQCSCCLAGTKVDIEEHDLMIGGFPCTSVSRINNLSSTPANPAVIAPRDKYKM